MRSLLLALVLLTSTAQADNVEMWLEKMNQSIHELTYTGTYVHINNDQIDTMQIVHRADEEGERERLQAFEGIVIAKRNRGLNSSFTVRKMSHGEGVERVFQTYSPVVDSVAVKRRGDVRRAKLYYLRGRTGKAARIREKI